MTKLKLNGEPFNPHPPKPTVANQTTSTTSAAQSITVTNNAAVDGYTVSSVALTTGTQFTISSNTCTGTIAAQATCIIQVTFNPTTTGAKSDTVTITSNAPDSPQTVSLSGTGTSSTPPSQSTIVSSPTPTVKPNATYTVTWTCSNTPTSAVLDGVAQGAPLTGQSPTYTMTGTVTHTIACTNANGSTQASVTVTQGGTIQGANTIRTANTVMQ